MESIVRNVNQIEVAERKVYEQVLGQQLRDNQQVIIRVLSPGVVPDEQVRSASLARAADIARMGREQAAAQGVSEEEVDAALDEATQHVRSRRQP
jgi:hypothetical protein